MKTILRITPGPTYWPRSPEYRRQFEAVPEGYSRHIFTSAPVTERIEFTRGTYRSLASRNRLVDRARFTVFCLAETVRSRMKGPKIDIVETYDPLWTGLTGWMAARILRARFVPWVNGVYTSKAQLLDQGATLTNRMKWRLVVAIMRFVIGRADAVKLLYRDQLAPLEHLLSGKPVAAFPGYIGTDLFRDLGEKKEVLLVGCPFRLKGIDVAIEAFKRIAPAYPDWTLKILGWFPDPRPLQAAMGNHPQIVHHASVRYSEMPGQIGACGILTLPSRSEAMGRVLVEAMAAGKPRIGSRVDGIPSVIEDGVDGLLVEPGNVDDLAAKLDRLMGDPGLRRALGEAGHARCVREFAPEVHVRRLGRFYDEVLSTLRPPSRW